MSQLSSGFRYGDLGWAARKLSLQKRVCGITYQAEKEVYVVTTTDEQEFKLPEDGYHQEWAKESRSILCEHLVLSIILEIIADQEQARSFFPMLHKAMSVFFIPRLGKLSIQSGSKSSKFLS
jgi:hypothetical protein